MTPAAGWIVLVALRHVLLCSDHHGRPQRRGAAARASPRRRSASRSSRSARLRGRRRRSGLHLQPQPGHRVRPAPQRESPGLYRVRAGRVVRPVVSCSPARDSGRYGMPSAPAPETARRAGIHVARIRTVAFARCAGLHRRPGGRGLRLPPWVHHDRLRRRHVRALRRRRPRFIGGREPSSGSYGKPIHPLLGGLVIATLNNGLDLLNITTAGTDVATAVVLLIAVAVGTPPSRACRGRPERGRLTYRRRRLRWTPA